MPKEVLRKELSNLDPDDAEAAAVHVIRRLSSREAEVESAHKALYDEYPAFRSIVETIGEHALYAGRTPEEMIMMIGASAASFMALKEMIDLELLGNIPVAE